MNTTFLCLQFLLFGSSNDSLYFDSSCNILLYYTDNIVFNLSGLQIDRDRFCVAFNITIMYTTNLVFRYNEYKKLNFVNFCIVLPCNIVFPW